MSWQESLNTYIWIFNVGRGNAAFIRTGLNQGFIIDMASSGDPEFSPTEFVTKHFVPKLDKYEDHTIAQAVLSHPHTDHINECERLGKGEKLAPKLFTCPHDKSENEAVNWERIKNPDGSDDLITAYKYLYANRKLPLQTIKYTSKRPVPPNLEYGLYYIRPPKCEKLHGGDNEYGNATSIMFYLRYGSNSMLLPGDMTPEGMSHVLRQAEGTEKRYTVFSRSLTTDHPNWHDKTYDQPSLNGLLKDRGLSILVAPHHGLQSCYSTDLYAAIKGGKPQLVVISDKKKLSDTDGKVHPNYQSADGASGLDVEVEGQLEKGKRSVSTMKNGHILICFNGTGVPRVFTNPDPERLLAKMD